MEITFNVHEGVGIRKVTPQELRDYALMCGLDRIAAGRYSSLFVLNLMILEKINGIDTLHVIEELRFLEGMRPSLQTKPASQFKGPHLKGLWHKHFMPALPSVMAHNIVNYLGKNGTRQIVEEVLDPSKSPIVTREMIEELSHRIAFESMEERGGQGKLTGEWVVFAKEDIGNYYLGIWSHTAGDESIASSIKAACVLEFPFLAKYFS
ncbi:hypothetical protein [Burkholderia latens]|uniref:Uncharacterized protein n=1 Tax=Burkholderia latens TaxID=488446 RepID=A0A6H9T4M6_9BURK|nr:hypothetical protein [Burkholderia latens]KAB0643839.1 hypothetical protein F7R21_05495 [Burkholderia latens]